MKKRIVRALVAAYPQSWRKEYGDELAALLKERRLTARVLADTALRGIQERFRRDAWFSCGLALFAWTAYGIFRNNANPFDDAAYQRYLVVWEFGLFLAGCLTSAFGFGKPVSAAVKAAVMGLLPELAAMMLWAVGLFHPLVSRVPGPHSLVGSRLALFTMTFPTPPRPGLVMVPVLLAAVIAGAVFFGALGALVGRGLRRFVNPRRAR